MNEIANSDLEKLTPPETAEPFDTVRKYTITVAGIDLDVKAIYDHFSHEDKFTRQDVKDFIKDSKYKILRLKSLEDAIMKKKGDQMARRIIAVVYDEIIDKMVDGGWLEFHVELSPEFEMQLIKQWAESVVHP